MVEEFKDFLQVTHFTHCLWKGFLSEAIKDSAGKTEILQAGHLGAAFVTYQTKNK